MMKSIFVLSFWLSLPFMALAQYAEDALRYSQYNYNMGSTARMQAIGGAHISLGGDISTAAVNPAGLGFFNKSVFVMTPALDFINADTEYGLLLSNGYENQGSEEAFKNNFHIANLGMVINFGKGRFTDDKFKGGSLAISLSSNNSYHLNRTYSGENNYNSLGDALAIEAGQTDPSFYTDDFETFGDVSSYDQAAYLSYLISPDFNGGEVNGYFADYDGFPVQREVIKERGSHYQINVAWGGNYDDRLYFGGGLATHIINMRTTRSFEETDFGTFDSADNFTQDPRLGAVYVFDKTEIRGAGVNFNAGIIFRPVSFLTLGASYASPGFLSFDEKSEFEFDVDWKPGALFVADGDTVDLNAQEGSYPSAVFQPEYRLRTPSRLNMGTSVFVGKNGFFSANLEYVDYSNMRYNADDASITDTNDDIRNQYESVLNVRVGGEYRMNNFMLRAGYAFLPDPFKNSSLQDRENISFGFGYRTLDYFIDFALVNSRFQRQAAPYTIDASQSLDNLVQAQPLARSDVNITSFAVTFGLNF